MSDSLWDEKRVDRYLRLYGDPRDKKGSQSILCRDAAQLIEGDSVLDVGCGMGHMIPHIEGYRYAGLDYSEEMLKALHKRFPLIQTEQWDATKEFPVTLGAYDTVISVSLLIHMPSMKDVIAVLQNMWSKYVCNKAIVFGVETINDSATVRPDGLTIRNISIETMRTILKEALGVKDKQISWVNQKYTFQQQIVVTPSKDNPIGMGQKLIQRTTLFKVVK